MKNTIKDIKALRNELKKDFNKILGLELNGIQITNGYKISFIFDMNINSFAKVINLNNQSILSYIGFNEKFIPINYLELEDEEYSTIEDICKYMNEEFNKRIELMQDKAKNFI